MRATQQFVAAEGDQISAIGQRFLGRGFVRQAVVFQIDEHATAKIDDVRQAMLVRKRSELRFGSDGGEALHRVVAGVHLHDGSGARRNRFGKIFKMRAIGGAHFNQLHARALHDVRYAKRPADFDQLAA